MLLSCLLKVCLRFSIKTDAYGCIIFYVAIVIVTAIVIALFLQDRFHQCDCQK